MNTHTPVAALVTGALAVGLVACGSTPGGSGANSGLCGQASQVTTLAVQHARQGPLARRQHQQGYQFRAKKITDPAAARSVAEAVCALPPMTSHAVACPIDTFATYVLVFSVGGEKFPPVSADPSGCQVFRGAGQPRTAARSPGFWETLREAERAR